MKAPLLYKLIPRNIRLAKLKNDVVADLNGRELKADEVEVLAFLENNDLHIFPYSFPKKYQKVNVEIHKDDRKGLLYTIWEGKKLYYKNGRDYDKARTYFNGLRMEQDAASPHLYLTNRFDVNEDDVVVDVGAAEGNFALSVIKRAAFIYLFEIEPEWIAALEATFEPWQEKVQITQKFVGDTNDETSVSLDAFFGTDATVNFIKADVEGAEGAVVQGATKLMAKQPSLKITICTYHRQEDAENLLKLAKDIGLSCHFSDGYMLFHYGKTNVVRPPYLRRGVLRGVKIN